MECLDPPLEGSVLFNEALNTFYLRLYGVGHMVKDQSDSERNPLLSHGLLFLSSSMDTTAFVSQSWSTGLEREIAD